MPVEAVLINSPSIDFATLLGVAYEALGRNVASAADASHRKMVDAEKLLSCLAALRNGATAITASLLAHVSFSVLLATDQCDLLDILDVTSGMSFVRSTTPSGIDIVVITGTLRQWRDAVVSATGETALPAVRVCYSKILLLFDRAGLTSIWSDFERSPALDRSGFLLEHR